jgi:hypothetical protein
LIIVRATWDKGTGARHLGVGALQVGVLDQVFTGGPGDGVKLFWQLQPKLADAPGMRNDRQQLIDGVIASHGA